MDIPADLMFDKIEFNSLDWPKKPLIFKKKVREIGNSDVCEIVAAFKSPFGKPGDLLWVRETWGQPYLEEDLANCKYLYKADWNAINQVKQALVGERWKPSIHMPKKASRIWLMIEDIRVERVQEVSQIDAQAEGIEPVTLHGESKWKRYDEGFCTEYPTISFKTLWYSINGEESWKANPWVWVIQFRALSTTGKPSDEVIQANYKEVRNG